ncbi:hypothetical protein GCM10023084_68460 [Streptomyces lacrimifluminis]|uniref:Uncharacterized protein n=1 Tax=Streptomyces lacrimifluminis TaxID=1500077 RepID=A0A917UIS7_9ACTN|nr:hypothetical protein GCM10012282_68150 [Streptomyces lacrimifluminis]
MGERPEMTERVARTCDPNVVHFLDGRNVHTYVRAVSTQDKRGPDNFDERGHRQRGTSKKGVPSVQPRMRIRGPVGPTSR